MLENTFQNNVNTFCSQHNDYLIEHCHIDYQKQRAYRMCKKCNRDQINQELITDQQQRKNDFLSLINNQNNRLNQKQIREQLISLIDPTLDKITLSIQNLQNQFYIICQRINNNQNAIQFEQLINQTREIQNCEINQTQGFINQIKESILKQFFLQDMQSNFEAIIQIPSINTIIEKKDSYNLLRYYDSLFRQGIQQLNNQDMQSRRDYLLTNLRNHQQQQNELIIEYEQQKNQIIQQLNQEITIEYNIQRQLIEHNQLLTNQQINQLEQMNNDHFENLQNGTTLIQSYNIDYYFQQHNTYQLCNKSLFIRKNHMISKIEIIPVINQNQEIQIQNENSQLVSYIGQISNNGNREGQGSAIYNNGDQYFGSWQNNMRNNGIIISNGNAQFYRNGQIQHLNNLAHDHIRINIERQLFNIDLSRKFGQSRFYYDPDFNQNDTNQTLVCQGMWICEVNYSNNSIKIEQFTILTTNEIFHNIQLNDQREVDENINVTVESPLNHTYVGQINNQLLYHGQGTIKRDDNILYEGQFREGIPEGRGIEYLENNIIYKGTYKNGKRHGNGATFKIDNQRQVIGNAIKQFYFIDGKNIDKLIWSL